MLLHTESTTKFVQDENYAKENKIGLWAMSFEFPWDFRKTNK